MGPGAKARGQPAPACQSRVNLSSVGWGHSRAGASPLASAPAISTFFCESTFNDRMTQNGTRRAGGLTEAAVTGPILPLLSGSCAVWVVIGP